MSTRNDRPITALTNSSISRGSPRGDVHLEGGRAGDHGLDVVPTRRGRAGPRCAAGAPASAVASSCGDVVGVTTRTARSPAGLSAGRLTDATPRSSATAARMSRSAGRRPGCRSVSTATCDLAVEPGAEAVGEQVVGRAKRAAGHGVAVVGEADPQRERRDGEDAEQHRRDHAVADRTGDDPLRPPAGARLGGRDLPLPDERHAQAVHPAADQAEQAREEGDRGHHGDRHHQRRSPIPSR